MKSALITLSVLSALLVAGCSRENNSTAVPKRVGRSYVPTSAAEVAASPSFKLEHTTASGIQYFVCPLPQEIARSISVDSSDYRFLNQGNAPFFLVPIRDGKIVELNATEAAEVADFVSKRGKK
jgi:hypothetical protein